MKILIVEDDSEIRHLIQQTLEEENFECQSVDNGLVALDLVQKTQPDLIVLDRMLPGMDGLEICSRIRQNKSIKDPYIIMLTAKGEEIDRIIGLSTGVDDYMVKPFSPRELAARVRAVLRRSLRHLEPVQIYKTQNFEIDLDRRIATRHSNHNSEVLELTAIEFKLLSTFLSYPNRVWSRAQLIEKLWGDDFFGEDRVVDSHVARLRKKVEFDSSQPTFIKTVSGVGYKFEDGNG
ncbi:response regulator transcription factor [Pseudanabaena mucicola]|jgi:two-component system OmpR family response regulator|uniref:Response regulator transcription factor n=1 Tax=Pseudanabaena mucicola FACHB-723 TaxID=2692860 RepID=A0ABR7ZZ56_9CYAN|nr:response regulator transcription factor [Pseudanabaena mucicola]MBD2189248.1 response regulator transcription factor [Pseudanabaena mucicola FACHB-723]